MLRKLSEIDHIDDGPGKPEGIQRAVGRRPIAEFGNSDGDLPMLQWTSDGGQSHLCLYVHHTDDAREWAYDRESHIGKLDKGLDEARARGWVVVDMKADWKRIFPGRSLGGRQKFFNVFRKLSSGVPTIRQDVRGLHT